MSVRTLTTWPDLWLGAWWWQDRKALLFAVLGLCLLIEFGAPRPRRGRGTEEDHPSCPEVRRCLAAVIAEGDTRLLQRVTSRVLDLRRQGWGRRS